MSKASNPEVNVGEHITLLTYAALDDIERSSGDENKANPCSVQTYGNLMKKAGDRCTSVKQRATYTTEVKQVLATMLGLMIDELESADLDETDSIALITEKAVGAGNIAVFIFIAGAAGASNLGPILISATDPKRWVNGFIATRSVALSRSPRLCKVISDAFEAFLKAIAWMLTQSLPYSGRSTLSQAVFLTTLAQLGFAHIDIADLITSIRPRPPAAPRKKKGGAVAPADDLTVDPADPADPEDEDDDGVGDI